MPPFTIQQQVTFLYTSDLAAGSAFLREKVGLTLALNQFDLCHIYQAAPNAFLGVCTNRPPAEDPAVTYSFVVSDADAAYETLKSRGVAFEAPPQFSERFNVYSAFFGGLESYRFEIQEFRDPAWPVPVA